MKNKFKLAANILFIVVTLTVFLYVFINFIKSFGTDGTDFWASKDYLYYSLSALILLIFSVYNLVVYLKQKSLGYSLYVSAGLASFILFAFEMGYFLKQMGKHEPFNDYKDYFAFGIIYLVITVFIVVKYFADNKNKEN